MRPLIGVSANFLHPDPDRRLFKNKRLAYFEQQLGEFLSRAGADVVGILHPAGAATLATLVSRLNGLVLAGGADVSPQKYGEQVVDPAWRGDPYQDDYELELLRLAEKKCLPVLGICRGCQVLNVYYGGSLYQDLAHFRVASRPHRDQDLYDGLHHTVHVERNTRLHEIVGATSGKVVSVHHQAVKDLGRGLRIAARSEDGIVEAIETESGDRFVVGVQWHPEWQSPENSPGAERFLDSKALVNAFLSAAKEKNPKGE